MRQLLSFLRRVARPHAAAACGAFVAAFAVASYVLSQFGPPPEAPPISEKLNLLARRAGEIDTLFLGSSRVYHGFSPDVFDRRMAEQGFHSCSFNLAADGMNFPETGYVLERALATGLPRLRRVFLELSALQTVLPEGQRGTRRFEAWHDWTRTRVVCASLLGRGDCAVAWEHVRSMLGRYNATGRGAESVARLLDGRFSAPPAMPSGDGYLGIPRAMGGREREQFLKDIAGISGAEREQRNDRHIQETIGRAVQCARATGAEVILVAMPATRRWPHVYENTAAVPTMEFDDPARFQQLYDPADRYDPAHLNTSGAEKFSRTLADALAARLAREGTPAAGGRPGTPPTAAVR